MEELPALRAADARLRAVIEAKDAQLAAADAALEAAEARIAALSDRVAELERRLGRDSSTSSTPSSDSPYRTLRGRSGLNPGKQPGAGSSTLPQVADPDETVVCAPAACAGCGADVLLTTTDPAAHLALTLGEPTDFEVSSIDPARAVAEYRQHVMDTKGANLDADGRANLAEDLRSPCTEEVAIFQAFSAAVEQADRRFVAMDTAPTGHTLLLMDATGAYHREVVRNMPHKAELTPLARLQNIQETSVIVVTLPETTPVLEGEGLAADLARAGIATWGWVVDRSLTPTGTASPSWPGRSPPSEHP